MTSGPAFKRQGFGQRTLRWFLVTEHGKSLFIFLLLFVVLYLPILIWARFCPADVLSVARIDTELISFDVVDVQKAAFHVSGMKVGERGSDKASCAAGLFRPGLGTKITYGRVGKGPIEIRVTPAARASGAATGLLDLGDGKPWLRYTGSLVLQEDDTCPRDELGARAIRLPIWGHAQIGHEFRPAAGTGRPEPSLLIDGKLDVSAHAFLTHSLYQVRSVTLPVASRLETGGDGGAIWWGIASIDPDKVALVVDVATVAPELALYRPYSYRTKPDIISVSALTQLTDDPTLIRIHIVLAILAALALVSGWIGKHSHDIAERKRTRSS